MAYNSEKGMVSPTTKGTLGKTKSHRNWTLSLKNQRSFNGQKRRKQAFPAKRWTQAQRHHWIKRKDVGQGPVQEENVQWWGQEENLGDNAGKCGIQDIQLSQMLYICSLAGL